MILTLLQLVLLFYLAVATENDSIFFREFFQNDYDVKMEILELGWYNAKYLTKAEIKLIFLNRTQRVVNASGTLLLDLTSNLTIEVQFYKLRSNEYRFFPISAKLNLCSALENNAFGVRDIPRNVTNLVRCPHKKGYYYINKYVPDFSRCPPHMVHGSYKITANIYWLSEHLLEFNGFGAIIDKPSNWGK